VTTDLELPLPFQSQQTTPHTNDPILIWGGSSSVGQCAIQILRHWECKNLLAIASKTHHEFLKSLGANALLELNLTKSTLNVAGGNVPFILDCIEAYCDDCEKGAKICGSVASISEGCE
jgi:NADPH:quinone reductase-like Zn-dependent oxidoreductase